MIRGMSGRQGVTVQMSAWMIVGLACAGSASAQTVAESLQRCRAVQDQVARLACYDRLAAMAMASAPGTPPALPGTTAPAVATVGPSPASAAQSSFGLPASADPTRVTSLQSIVPGRFDGWDPGGRITLANGQVWQVVDGSRAWFPGLQDVKVTIRTGAFGAYYLEIEGQNNSPRVRRVQ